jgi:nicotinamidase-related amidase
MRKICLLCIDGQEDFMDKKRAALPVPNANADMDRVALMVRDHGSKIDGVVLPMDGHLINHIAHGVTWVNKRGRHPKPFTQILHDDVVDGVWTPEDESLRSYALWYTRKLERQGKFKLTIWKPHCLIGTPGHNLQANLNNSIQEWMAKYKRNALYVPKGINCKTEHYGAIVAEIPLSNDRGTWVNRPLLKQLRGYDIILVAGEAFSHCVRETVSQTVKYIGAEHVKKLRILRDCTSSIPAITDPKTGAMIADFPSMTAAWLKDVERQGVVVTDSVSFWK